MPIAEAPRLSPARVKAAFADLGHNWNPVQGDFLTLDRYADGDEWNDCCGLTAVYLASFQAPARQARMLALAHAIDTSELGMTTWTPDAVPPHVVTMAETLGLSLGYALGFVTGWDGGTVEPHASAEEQAGWDDAADLFAEITGRVPR